MQEYWRSILRGLKPEIRDSLTLEKALVNREGTRLMVCFHAPGLIVGDDYNDIKRSVRAAFPGREVAVRVSCPELKEQVERDITPYWEFIKNCALRQLPACKPFFRHCTISQTGTSVTVNFPDEAVIAFMLNCKASELLSKLCRELFQANITFDFTCSGEMDERLRYISEMRKKDEQLLMERLALEQKANAKTQAEKKPELPQVLYGRSIDTAPMQIDQIAEDAGRVTVAGEIVTTDLKEVKDGALTIVTFTVTDYTGTVYVKAFLRAKQGRGGEDGPAQPAQPDPLKEYLAPGKCIKVRGQYRYDDFLKEMVVMLSDAEQQKKEVRKDNAPRKRVELHMHTQMSTMDGVSSATALIKRAISWGFPAIAVTDHGVCQAFPDAFKAAGKDIKFIPGCEGYLIEDAAQIVDEADDRELGQTAFVVFDVETTGLNGSTDMITEIGAVRIENGEEVAEFSELVNPGRMIPEKVVELTGITDAMVRDCPTIEELAPKFYEFCKGAVLVAHNASFDTSFIKRAFANIGGLHAPVLDTLALSRNQYAGQMKSFKLGSICKFLGISLKNAHRAVHDARATSKVLVHTLSVIRAQHPEVKRLIDLNSLYYADKDAKSWHIILLAKSQDGLTNLNRIVSEAHLHHFHKHPRIPRSVLQKYREGIIVGSACEAGELFRAMVAGKSEDELLKIASFYDYLEIQPIGNNAFMIREGTAKDEEALRDYNRHILALGDKLKKPVCATCDVHFLDPKDAKFRAILMAGQGFADADQQAPLYLRTTEEMLEEFSYLGDRAEEVVIDNPNKIADMVQGVKLFIPHPKNEVTFQPFWPDAADNVRTMAESRALEVYGDPLPDIVRARLDKELKSILGYGFGTLYNIAQKLVKKSTDDGYIVGSRGSVGSSLVAHFIGITEVNALPPHYVCPVCKYSDWDPPKGYTCGPDLPKQKCPKCGADMRADGFDIPFETFLGFYGDKVPDIDLNFSGVYQPRAHAYIEELFGKGNVFRAGTIGTLAEKTAYGYVNKYLEERGLHATRAEKDRLVAGCVGVKRTTGQHPGGIVVLPKDYEIYQFTAIQHPADDNDTDIITTHYDFNSMHDVLVKLDCLGHDDPTMLRALQDITGISPKQVPLGDPKVMSLFTSPEALGVTPDQIYGCKSGTLGIPEFGTRFVRGMLEETQPHTMEELIRIAGLSHGTDVWLGNAQELVKSGQAQLKDCICNRDDIMNFLIKQGLEPKMAFTTMESVRKGKGLKPEMESAMNEHNTPEWFIDSCKKIKYMFPKGHSVAYVTMSLRIAYFKVYYPVAYYKCYLQRNLDVFDASIMMGSANDILEQLVALDDKGKDISAKEANIVTMLEILLEMHARHMVLLPCDLYESEVDQFVIKSDHELLIPFTAIPGLGANAAQVVVDARREGPFISVEDMLKRHIGKATIELLRKFGCLKGMPETSQMSLFDMM